MGPLAAGNPECDCCVQNHLKCAVHNLHDLNHKQIKLVVACKVLLTGLDRVFELGLWAVRPWLCQPILAPVFPGLPELIRGEVCCHWQGRRGLNLPFHGVCIRVILVCWAQIHPQKVPCNRKACVATCTHPVLCCHSVSWQSLQLRSLLQTMTCSSSLLGIHSRFGPSSECMCNLLMVTV